MPGVAVTRYERTGEPPLVCGACQLTTAWAIPGLAAIALGGVGTPRGCAILGTLKAGEVPDRLVAVTDAEYVTPLVKLKT